MSFLMTMLLSSAGGTSEVNIPDWLEVILDALTNFIGPILIVVAVAGIVYAVVVGIRFAKADDKSAREEAKQKLIYVIVGIVVTIVLIALFYFLEYAIKSGMIKFDSWYQDYVPEDDQITEGGGEGTTAIGSVLRLASVMLR